MPVNRNYSLEGIADNVELGKDGPRIKDDGTQSALEVRNPADSDYLPLRAASPVGDNDVVTKEYLETTSGLRVTGQINGGSPPAAGTAGRVFIVTTAGGSYALGELYRDNGTSWVQITVTEGMRISITDDLTGGTDEYTGDHIYLWDEDGSAWVDIGPAPSLSRAVRVERLTIDYADAGDNNLGQALPANAIVLKAKVNVTQVFDGTTPTLIIGDATDADRHLEAKDVKLDKVGIYWVEQSYLYGSSTQVLANLTIGGTPTQGQAQITLEYAVE